MIKTGAAEDREAGHSPNLSRAQPSTRAPDASVIPTSGDIISHVDASIKDNSFARAMEAIRASQCYRDDLPEQDVLELIPRG